MTCIHTHADTFFSLYSLQFAGLYRTEQGEVLSTPPPPHSHQIHLASTPCLLGPPYLYPVLMGPPYPILKGPLYPVLMGPPYLYHVPMGPPYLYHVLMWPPYPFLKGLLYPVPMGPPYLYHVLMWPPYPFLKGLLYPVPMGPPNRFSLGLHSDII